MARHLFNRTVRNFFMAACDQGLVSGTNFITGLLLARFSSKDEYGLYILAFSLILIADALRGAFVSFPLTVNLPRHKGDAKASYLGGVFYLHGSILAAGGILSLIASVFLYLLGDVVTAKTIAVAVVAFVAYLSREHLRKVFLAQLLPRSSLMMALGVAVSQLGALWALKTTGKLSAINVLLVLGTVQSFWFGCGLLILHLRGHCAFGRFGLREVVKTHWAIGKWALTAAGAAILTYQAYPWLLKATKGLDAVAIFGAASAIAFLSNPLMGLTNYIAPQLAHAYAANSTAGLTRATQRGQGVIGIAMLLFTIGILLFGSRISMLAYDGKYPGLGPIIVIITLGRFSAFLACPMFYALYILHRGNLVFYANMGGMIITLGFGSLAAIVWGVQGAAIGYMTGNVGSAGLCWFFYRRALLSASSSETNEDAETTLTCGRNL